VGRFSSRLPLTTEVRPEGSEMAEGGIRYFRRISSIRENYGPLLLFSDSVTLTGQ